MPKHGIVEVDPSGRVTSFLEKPAVRETQSRKQSPCFYLLSRPAVSGLKAESNTNRSFQWSHQSSFWLYGIYGVLLYISTLSEEVSCLYELRHH